LAVPEKKDLLFLSSVNLGLDNLGGDEAFKERPVKDRPGYVGIRLESKQMGGQAGIGKVKFGGLDQALSEVFKIGWDEQDQMGRLEDIQPLGNSGNGNPERRC